MRTDDAVLKLELAISRFLRFGVFISAIFLTLGWTGQILSGKDRLGAFHEYHPEALSTTFKQALAGNDYTMVSAILGLGILVSLPILRVFLTAYLFLRQKDWLLAGMAVFVFCVLLSSFFMGIDA